MLKKLGATMFSALLFSLSYGNVDKLLERHEPWLIQLKKIYAERHFSKIAMEVRKWIEDCALFTYGYLVRKFSEKVLETKRIEEEIWITSFFNVTVNAIKRSKRNQ